MDEYRLGTIAQIQNAHSGLAPHRGSIKNKATLKKSPMIADISIMTSGRCTYSESCTFANVLK